MAGSGSAPCAKLLTAGYELIVARRMARSTAQLSALPFTCRTLLSFVHEPSLHKALISRRCRPARFGCDSLGCKRHTDSSNKKGRLGEEPPLSLPKGGTGRNCLS